MQKLFQNFINRLPPLYRPVAFEPVLNDGDILTKAINADVHNHDNDWELKDSLDGAKLEAFWDEVLTDLGADKTNQ